MEQIDLMVVDDHALVREGIISMLSSSGDLRIVNEAENGVQALKLLEKELPDVAIAMHHTTPRVVCRRSGSPICGSWALDTTNGSKRDSRSQKGGRHESQLHPTHEHG